MTKILILGGSGYLGKNFINLFKNKINIISPSKKELNLLKKKSIDKYFKNIDRVDFILNFCVYQQTGSYLIKNAQLVKDRNKLLNNNVLYLWSTYLKKSKLISVGASCAYSYYKSNFSYTKGKLYGGTKDFALSKRNLAKECKKLNKTKKMKYLILVPGTLIGPGEQLNLKKMHFFNGVLYRAALYKNKKLINFNFIMNRDVIRDLTFVNNFCNEIIKTLKLNKNGIINFIPDYRISLKQFYNLVEKRLLIKKRGDFKKSLFKGSIKKSYEISVKKDLTKRKNINNKTFLRIFDSTFKDFLSKTKN